MQRTLVSYSDIADPQPPEPIAAQSTSSAAAQPPPAKRRRKSKGGKNNNAYAQGDFGPPEQSRDLAHEEIWDDSALIDAWNAATEEYEVLNGPDKKWKHEPVHKSALWYNSLPQAAAAPSGSKADDSAPLDFDSYVPTHVPLPNQKDGAPAMHAPSFSFPPMPSAPNVSSDEALQNAYGAWYWAGYWSGVYQTMNAGKTRGTAVVEDPEEITGAELDESVNMDLEDGPEDGEVS
ncbi:hypothetical protein EXIGLDRAFT_760354 [Exidia glandulosa HHB12029]|uniref:Survival Motor Neuron Gemin2-binding domain-containing protein n=1 Tax=Exidia glandulosa HHB12029 TaxID=1314781 RepID=A0A165PGC2_EXIGL|nr:hypothetical protein EXIGLDRAFT_760354 [Exidia glandulosa HHB12029]